MPRRDKNADELWDRASPWLLLAVAGVLVTSLWLGWLVMVGGLPSQDTALEKRGAFGDAFGALNALFAGLAFAGVIVALFVQIRELRLQRRELELQRRELELQRAEMAMTREELAGQRRVLEESHSFELERARQAAQPILREHRSNSKGEANWERIELVNRGAPVTEGELSVMTGDAELFEIGPLDALEHGAHCEFGIGWPSGKLPGVVTLGFRYLDANGERGEQLYRHEPKGMTRIRLIPKSG